jgi:PAS domain S-box-containing protein
MADTETLDWKVEAVLERLQALLEQAGGPPDERATLVDAAAVLSASLEELRRARAEAESRLEERMADLVQANAALQAEVAGQRQVADEAQSLARFPAENPSPVLRLSEEGMLLYANDACGGVLGDWGCGVGNLAPLFWRDLAAGVFAGGSARTVDVPIGDRVYSFAVVPVAEAGYVNLYGQDVTQRVQAEEQLRESEERFHSLYVTMAEGMALHEVVYDEQGEVVDYTLLDANPVFEAITGLPREQSVGRKASDLYGTGEPPYLELYARVAASGEPTSFETYFPPMDKYFSISVFSPGPGRFATVFSDITERVRAEEAVRYQAYLLENTSDAIISSDTAFVIRSWNWAAEEIYGWRADEVIGKSAGQVLQAEFDEPAEEVTRRFFAEGYWKGEVVHRRKDGTPVHILGAVRLLRDEAGNPSVVVSANRDITERKQVEAQRDAMLEELKAALAEKEVLMREIYHRVKNNVQALIYLMEMQGEYIEDPSALRMIRELQDRARTMALVHEKLYQSRNLAQIDFGDYLRDLVANLSHALWTDRPLTWQIDVENAWISVDMAIPCGLIVNELLTNALKYAFPDSHPCVERGEMECQVCVEFRAGQDGFTLVVGDNGVGLPPGMDWTATKSLGLQLIGILVHHQLEGQIELDNHAGATFTITFAERE